MLNILEKIKGKLYVLIEEFEKKLIELILIIKKIFKIFKII